LAVEGRDVGTVPGIDQGLVRALRDEGVSTIAELLERFDEARLSNFERPWGGRKQRVGKSAQKILRLARALATGKEEVIQKPKIPDSPDYVMFDLEGLPPQLDDLDKIYLWGMQVFGTNPSDYIGKVAGLGPNGDREGWLQFLAAAKLLFDKYGDIPFVHWHVYEKTHLHRYIERYGDAEGIAARIAKNLFDLLPATQESIALPISSYSLKVVEEYVGYKRTQDEYGGDWAMATFIKATETSDSNEREKMLKEILIYNKEDLAATWAVLQWLRGKSLQ
jgi:predicted RecB family nuclease